MPVLIYLNKNMFVLQGVSLCAYLWSEPVNSGMNLDFNLVLNVKNHEWPAERYNGIVS